MLYIRMALYLIGGALAGYGLATFDPEAGTITFQIDALAQALSGLATFLGTFWVSRIAKKRGGVT